MDTRENRIAEVVWSRAGRARLRRPGGGVEWEVPFAALRLATRAEREAAGVRATAARSPVGCVECAGLEVARRQAVAHGDKEAIVDATVAVRSHFRDAHLLPGRTW
ncbi:hypothetical protein [Streptomyces cinnamoneus]|uniref:hypothetical protein n=1 Tax=Streptomyces cinnamoneus TaxID=53446 RepID=UPI00167E66E4|nr:hypothetical protein [Streptomyces cinnamoneus]